MRVALWIRPYIYCLVWKRCPRFSGAWASEHCTNYAFLWNTKKSHGLHTHNFLFTQLFQFTDLIWTVKRTHNRHHQYSTRQYNETESWTETRKSLTPPMMQHKKCAHWLITLIRKRGRNNEKQLTQMTPRLSSRSKDNGKLNYHRYFVLPKAIVLTTICQPYNIETSNML